MDRGKRLLHEAQDSDSIWYCYLRLDNTHRGIQVLLCVTDEGFVVEEGLVTAKPGGYRTAFDVATCNTKIWHREIASMYKIRNFLNHLPVLGLTLSGYNILLIQQWLFTELGNNHLSSSDNLGAV